MDPMDAGYDPRKDFDMYSASEDLRDYSDIDLAHDMKVGKTL